MSLVTHLECSLTGERYEAGKPHNLSKAGKPMLVRYDFDAVKQTLTRESIASREPGMAASTSSSTMRGSPAAKPPRKTSPTNIG